MGAPPPMAGEPCGGPRALELLGPPLQDRLECRRPARPEREPFGSVEFRAGPSPRAVLRQRAVRRAKGRVVPPRSRRRPGVRGHQTTVAGGQQAHSRRFDGGQEDVVDRPTASRRDVAAAGTDRIPPRQNDRPQLEQLDTGAASGAIEVSGCKSETAQSPSEMGGSSDEEGSAALVLLATRWWIAPPLRM